MTFAEDMVALTFHQEHPETLKPAVKRLRSWDADLTSTWNDILIEVLPDFDLDPDDKKVKSVVMTLARSSNGGDAETMTRQACRYFVHIANLELGDEE